MSELSKLRKAKTDWKEKAVKRAGLLCDARKKISRIEQRAEKCQKQMEQEIKSLRAQNANAQPALKVSSNLAPLASTADLQTLCVLIVISGIVSFRAVPRILSVLRAFGHAVLPIPHFTSVIHWALRAGVEVFSTVCPVSEPWIAIIDCSIDIGTRKALVVLRVSLDALKNRKGAIILQDCECIGLKISNTWNGKLIADALKSIFAIAGQPMGILKDGGTDLSKGVHLYRESQTDKKSVVLDDVGHVAANALKAEFSEQTAFLKFLNILRKGAARIRQTDLAWLLPPKVRTKGRFQGITEVAEWAKKIVTLMGGQGRAIENGELSKLRKAFAGLAQLTNFLGRFCIACATVEKVLKLLKKKGLNQETYREAKELLAELPENSTTHLRLNSWLEKHLSIHCRLGIGQIPLLVSSDIIESLFGKFKTVIQRNPQAELNRLVYVIPLLCGVQSKIEIATALTNCSHKKMLEQIQNTIPITLRQQRNRVLNRGPNPGTDEVLKTG